MTATTKERVKAPKITDEVRAKIAEIEAIDLTDVRERVLSEGSVPEAHVDLAINEYRRWLVLAAFEPESMVMFSKYVDEVWHAHILFTRQYSETCNQSLGYYLHHSPFTSRSTPTPEQIADAAARFRKAYKQTFGKLPPRIWRMAQLDPTAECFGCSSNCRSGCTACADDGKVPTTVELQTDCFGCSSNCRSGCTACADDGKVPTTFQATGPEENPPLCAPGDCISNGGHVKVLINNLGNQAAAECTSCASVCGGNCDSSSCTTDTCSTTTCTSDPSCTAPSDPARRNTTA